MYFGLRNFMHSNYFLNYIGPVYICYLQATINRQVAGGLVYIILIGRILGGFYRRVAFCSGGH